MHGQMNPMRLGVLSLSQLDSASSIVTDSGRRQRSPFAENKA